MALSICMETDLMKVMIDAASSAIFFETKYNRIPKSAKNPCV